MSSKGLPRKLSANSSESGKTIFEYLLLASLLALFLVAGVTSYSCELSTSFRSTQFKAGSALNQRPKYERTNNGSDGREGGTQRGGAVQRCGGPLSRIL